MEPRPYQQDALDALDEHLLKHPDENPCVQIPTGGGKTPLMAWANKKYWTQYPGLRILVLAHVKELLTQGVDKMRSIEPQIPIGVYSASLRQKSHQYALTYANIQSIFRKAREAVPWDIIHVDEAHRIPLQSDGMYRRFLADIKDINPNAVIIGWTATPFRMGGQPICTPTNFLNRICYSIGVDELIEQGYLSRITSRSLYEVDRKDLHLRNGEFITEELENLVDTIIPDTIRQIIDRTKDRNSVLIFCISVEHAEKVRAEMLKQGVDAPLITGETMQMIRDATIARFTAREVKYLLNVNVLSEGFDAPGIDCVVMLRPTNSMGLYYQQVGRGFRLFPGKENCLVLDFAGNIITHGPVDLIAAVNKRKKQDSTSAGVFKKCPECKTVVAGGCHVCPECGYEFPKPPPEIKHASMPSMAAVVSSEMASETMRVKITWANLDIFHPTDGRPSMGFCEYGCVDCTNPARTLRFREFLLFDHAGVPAMKARAWWRARYPETKAPASVAEFTEIIGESHAGDTKAILDFAPEMTIRKRGKYWNVVTYHKQATAEMDEPAPF